MMYARNPNRRLERGFSFTELLISLTLSMIIMGLAFYLLGQSINRRSRVEDQSAALADTLQALGMMSREIANSGFGLQSNGLVEANCSEEKIRFRANLNALAKETTSNSVTDQDEDVQYLLITNSEGQAALVREDVSLNSKDVIALNIDNRDVNDDGDSDGLTFNYVDRDGNTVSPSQAVRVEVVIRIMLPEVGTPGAKGYQPPLSKQLYSSVVLRNSQLISY